jgi:hypothetical protein
MPCVAQRPLWVGYWRLPSNSSGGFIPYSSHLKYSIGGLQWVDSVEKAREQYSVCAPKFK